MAALTTDASVILWGREVAAVSWIEEKGFSVFQFDPDFAQSCIEISPLTVRRQTSLVQGNDENMVVVVYGNEAVGLQGHSQRIHAGVQSSLFQEHRY